MRERDKQTRILFAARLAEARALHGLTQAELATRCGMIATNISHYETGGRTPGIAQLARLCRALGCRADYLLGIT